MYPNSDSVTKFLYSFIKKQPIAFLVFFLTPMLMILESTAMPYAIKMIIDCIVSHQGSRLHIFTKLKPALCMYIGSWLILITIARLQNWWQAYVLPKFEADIRMESLNYVLSHSYYYFSNQFSGNLANKIRDLPKSLDAIRMILCWNLIATLSVAMATLIAMATINKWCSCITAIWISIHLCFIVYFGKFINVIAEKNAEDKSQLNGIIVDLIANISSVKLFSQRSGSINEVKEQQEKEITSNKQLILSYCQLRFLSDLLVSLALIALIYFLIVGWQRNIITAGDFIFIIQSTFILSGHIWFLGESLSTLFSEIGVAKQALTILQASQEIVDQSNAKTLQINNGLIEFDNVTFHYKNGNRLFQNKNLIIKSGSKVGLVGFSGSGKTTFANLILRFFEIHSGQIRIDGQNIQEVTQDSLHAAIAMIPQDTSLFHRTLMENIRYGKPNAYDQEVILASKSAHCHEFISQLPEQYQTLVGERGVKLSGGQRQRIAIARAILKNAPIVILDEATSALDSVTEQLIQESLRLLTKNRTTIIIAHRLSTLAAMDRILVFDKGQIIEDGSQEQLLKQNGRFAYMWQMQSGDFLPDQCPDPCP
jgi:ATP-binding cassette subfamily B protein